MCSMYPLGQSSRTAGKSNPFMGWVPSQCSGKCAELLVEWNVTLQQFVFPGQRRLHHSHGWSQPPEMRKQGSPQAQPASAVVPAIISRWSWPYCILLLFCNKQWITLFPLSLHLHQTAYFPLWHFFQHTHLDAAGSWCVCSRLHWVKLPWMTF